MIEFAGMHVNLANYILPASQLTLSGTASHHGNPDLFTL